MAVQRSRVGATRAVSGQDWIQAGQEAQGEFWDHLRAKLLADMLTGGWQQVVDPIETIEYDEERGVVILHIRAVAEREGDPSPIDYGARGGQPFGYA